MDPAGHGAAHRPDAEGQERRHRRFRRTLSGGRGGKARGAHSEGPGLEDDDVAGLAHGPFDVLGAAEVFLQHQGDFRQGAGLDVGQGGGLGLFGREFHLRHAAVGLAGQGHGLLQHPPLFDGMTFTAGNDIEIRGDGAVDGVLPQAPDGADQDGVGFGGVGVDGEHDAAGPGRDHGEDAHGHGELADGKLLVFPIEDGPGGEFAGNDFLVMVRQPGGVDVEQGGELAGKGKLGVFAHGAGAHRQPGGGQRLGRLRECRLQLRGQRRPADQSLDLLAHRLQALQVVDGGLGQPGLQFTGELGPLQKALVGRGGDGKTLGHRQAHMVADLAQVGHLAPHRRGQVPV